MSRNEVLARLRAALAARAQSYGRAVVALSLNVPLLLAALARYPEGLSWTGLGGLYACLVFVGYYVLILLVILTCLFLISGPWLRFFAAASTALLATALYYFVVDGVVYRALRMHVDAFWLQYLFTTFDGIGISDAQVLGAVALLLLIILLEWWIFRLAARIRARKPWLIGLTTTCTLAFLVSQALHIAAYEANDTRITAITPALPFYYPVTSHRTALKYGGQLAMIREAAGPGTDNGLESLRYPLHDVSCRVTAGQRRANLLVLLLESWRADALDSIVTPRMYAFSKRGSVFLNHFSTGNSTPAGVFPIFYGLHPTYWTAVKANAPFIQNPVLIDVLGANGYAFGIYAESHFDRHKIKDTVFRGIEVHETFQGETVDARDRDLTDRLLGFMASSQRAGKPFFGFGYYKSTHYSYHYPPNDAPFQPARELSMFSAAAEDDPTPVLNDYRNSLHYVDGLVGELLQRMEKSGLLDSTIVIISSDHGEEFNDNGTNYWGHTGNFTAFQTRVPLIVFNPWRPGRRVGAVTSAIDLPPTLLQEGLGCGQNAPDYSNGLNLFGPLPDTRPVVIASYVNHALIVGDDVFVVWPLYVQRYRLNDIRAAAGHPSLEVFQQALNEMTRFYRRAGTSAPAP